MKLYFAIIIIALNSALGFAQVAEFTFLTKSKVKFEKINEGEIIKHYYVFENSGTTPLVIHDYNVSCTCTSIKFPNYPIAPNEKDSILVVFDSNGKYYLQDRTVDIESNAENKIKLRFKVYVIPKDEE